MRSPLSLLLLLQLGLSLLGGSSAGADSTPSRTLALIKPDAVLAGHVAAIQSMIRDRGLRIVEEKEMQLSVQLAREFYQEHQGAGFFENLVEFMTSGPIVAMVLEGPRAVDTWRHLMGPTSSATARETRPKSVRAAFGVDVQRNAVHGSDSPASARRERNWNRSMTSCEPETDGQEA
eukprot:jgi/Mesen1/10782/ME000091S10309